MYVTKRNGQQAPVAFDKIRNRAKKAADGLQVEFYAIAKKVIDGLYDGVTTRELDGLMAETAASMALNHPDYTKFAARVAISAYHKETDRSFVRTMKRLYQHKNEETGEPEPLISEHFYGLVLKHGPALESIIDYDRDYLFDYFGFCTLRKQGYLLGINSHEPFERPQHLYMRVALAILEDDLAGVEETYHYLSTHQLSHATPTLLNAGTQRQQLSSCFLLTMQDDSVDGIYDTLKQTAKISQAAGGVGLAISNIRSEGARIRTTGSKSTGIKPMIKVFNDTARYIDQGGRRKGAFAMYLEPWHADTLTFLEMKLPHGKEENRARDLFYALWIPDLFWRRYLSGGNWTFFSPDEAPGLQEAWDATFEGGNFTELYERYEREGRGRGSMPAAALLDRIIDAQTESGVPYMLNKDQANRKSNQQNLGTIKSSNLCVAPETQLLTSAGYQTIADLEGETVEVWNGEEFSAVQVRKTSESSPLVTVSLSNGQTLDATLYHKWYVQRGYKRGTGGNQLQIVEKRTHELVAGDKLIKLVTPVIEFEAEFPDAYTQGFFTGDGCSYQGKNHIDLYGSKLELAPHLVGKLMGSYQAQQDKQRFQVSSDYRKFTVPFEYSVSSRLEWFAGLADSDGCLLDNQGTQSLQIASTHRSFLQDVQLMLQTLGVNSKVIRGIEAGLRVMPDGKGGEKEFSCNTTWRLNVGADALFQLSQLGFVTRRLALSFVRPNRNAERFVKVLSVEDKGRVSATYCATEPKRNRLVFNGVLTGNCTEIIEYTSEKEVAVCNLASLPLPRFVKYTPEGEAYFDHQELYRVTKRATYNLNRVIDVTYNPVPEAEYSNKRHRPIGLGPQGLADAFALLSLPFDSVPARILNREISETMYFAAVEASMELAREHGPYETYPGSPISKGLLQFDMWEENQLVQENGQWKKASVGPVSLSGRWDWATLRGQIAQYGVRNSLLIAPMPTASTASILGNNESFEPYTSNVYTRRTLSGEYIMVNSHLVRRLEAAGLWSTSMKNAIVAADGSIQSIAAIPADIKALFKTVWEIRQRVIIDQAADRGAFVCQSQSMNLHIAYDPKAPTQFRSNLRSAWVYGTLKGLKTLSYYIRTTAATTANKKLGNAELVPEPRALEASFPEPEEGCDMCSA